MRPIGYHHSWAHLTDGWKPSPAACHLQLCQLLVAQLWALLGNNDPATTRPSNQSQRLPGARGTRWRKPRLKGLGAGQTVNTTGDRPDRLDVVVERKQSWLISFHPPLLKNWGGERVGFEYPNCQEVDLLWVSWSCPKEFKSDHCGGVKPALGWKPQTWGIARLPKIWST